MKHLFKGCDTQQGPRVRQEEAVGPGQPRSRRRRCACPTLSIPAARLAPPLPLLPLHLGLEVLDLPAQVGDDVCVLCDVVGHAQQVTLDLVAGRNQGQGLWLPWERLLSCDGNTQARFIRKTQISPLSLKGEGWRLKREGSDTCYHMGGP